MAPLPIDLLIVPRWVIPVEPAGALVDHAVAVDAGRIVAVGALAELLPRVAPVRRVDLPDHALIPGLVNAHTHAAMALLRGIADDVPLKAWLEEHIWPREGRFVSPDFVHDGSLLAGSEMLRGGVTCCQDMYFYPDATARALREAGMRPVLGIPVLEFPTPYAADPDSYLQIGLATRDAWRDDPLVSFTLAPHAPYTVADATFEKIVMYAEQLELSIQTHLHETAHEIDESIARTGLRPLARLEALAVTGPAFIAIHAVHLSDADRKMLATRRSHVVHCPSSNLKLASGIAPISALVADDVNVALGTDGAASNNRLDLFEEMRLAALLAKVQADDAATLPAPRVLRMATLGGARALGLGGEVGSIEPGKAADLTAVDLGSLELAPCYDPVSHLVYAASRNDVTHVWVAGMPVVENRLLTTVDRAALAARARYWQERLA